MSNHLNKDNKKTLNEWADFWRYSIGVNVIPVNTKERNSYVKWSEWQDKAIPEIIHEEWKKENAFENGMAIMPGRIWHKDDKNNLYLIFIDLDNQKAIDEFCECLGLPDLKELSKQVIVEQHKDDLSRAHIYFYSNHSFKKKSSDVYKVKKEIQNNTIPSIEVKGLGSHGIAFCCPSLHKNGYKYEIIGTESPKTFSKEIEGKLFNIYRKFQLNSNKNGKVSINDLFKNDFTVLKGHNRHEALLRVMESLIKRNKQILDEETIKNLCCDYNQSHLKPPLEKEEVEKLWRSAKKFLNGDLRNNDKTKNKDQNSIYKIVQYGQYPLVYYIDDISNEICYGSLIGSNIIPKKTIVDVAPEKVTLFNNPLFNHIKLIEIRFSNDLCIGPCKSMIDIIKTLENKGHVISKYKAQDALNSVVSALRDKELVETIDHVTTPGYYMLDGEMMRVNDTQRREIDKVEVKKCCEFLNFLGLNGWNNKNIFSTALKWGIISPFSFLIKYNSDRWVQWLQLYGHAQTGKTSLGKIILSIWNLSEKTHSLGFNHIDTEPRFGNIVSKDTYPRLVNEVGALSTNQYGKYTKIIESIKYSIENITSRGKYVDYNTYQEIPALSPMILTSNYQPINDSGYNRRMILIHFSRDEKKVESEQILFNELFEKNKTYLKVLGDFTALYIQENKNELLEKPWVEVSKNILKKFYLYAEMEAPEWIEFFEEQKDAVDESTEKTHFGLRAFMIDRINETFTRHIRSLDAETKSSLIMNDIRSKIEFSLKNNLISFLHSSDYDTIVITVDIMAELKNNELENLTSLKDVGSLLDFKYVNKNFNGKKMRVLEGSLKKLVNFIELKIS